jgi:hypothetical protein
MCCFNAVVEYRVDILVFLLFGPPFKLYELGPTLVISHEVASMRPSVQLRRIDAPANKLWINM